MTRLKPRRERTSNFAESIMSETNRKKKYIPGRTCVGCREKKEKSELLRLVAAEDGKVLPDETGKAAGRGAYLCRCTSCLEKAIRSKALDRALKLTVVQENRDRLTEYFSERFGEKAD